MKDMKLVLAILRFGDKNKLGRFALRNWLILMLEPSKVIFWP